MKAHLLGGVFLTFALALGGAAPSAAAARYTVPR
jgi:hypothetical protein